MIGRLRAVMGRARARLRALAHPEVVAGGVIAALAGPVALAGVVPPVLALASGAFGLVLHLAAVDRGRYSLQTITTAWLVTMVGVATTSILDGAAAVTLAAVALVVLIHHELVRLAFARRRRAVIDRGIYLTSVLALGGAGLLAVLALAVVEPLATPAGPRPWRWMPIATLAVVAVAIAFAVVPRPRRAGPEARGSATVPGRRDRISAPEGRWEPGERLEPWRGDDVGGT